jgi:hypothetical protein
MKLKIEEKLTYTVSETLIINVQILCLLLY